MTIVTELQRCHSAQIARYMYTGPERLGGHGGQLDPPTLNVLPTLNVESLVLNIKQMHPMWKYVGVIVLD